MLRWLAILSLLGLAACNDSLISYGNEPPPPFQFGHPQPEPGFTLASSTVQHGIQVSYYGENGEYALWYPGNDTALIGTWRRRDRSTYCYTYRTASFNPATRRASRAGEEICNSFYGPGDWVSKVPGDVFNLRSGNVPGFDLTRCVLPPPLTLEVSTGRCRPR